MILPKLCQINISWNTAIPYAGLIWYYLNSVIQWYHGQQSTYIVNMLAVSENWHHHIHHSMPNQMRLILLFKNYYMLTVDWLSEWGLKSTKPLRIIQGAMSWTWDRLVKTPPPPSTQTLAHPTDLWYTRGEVHLSLCFILQMICFDCSRGQLEDKL